MSAPHPQFEHNDSVFSTSPSLGPEYEYMWWDCDSRPDYINNLFLKGLSGLIECDVYSGNLPNGKYFKFILHPDNRTPVMVEKADNILVGYGSDYINIIDSDGTIYRYEAADYSSATVFSYRLALITSKEGHQIRLTYTTVREYTIPGISETYTFNRPPGEAYMPKRSYSNWAAVNTSYLSAIESDKELITFQMSIRDDKAPGISGRLIRMRIKNKLTQKTFFCYDFNHDYFTGVRTGGDFLSQAEKGTEEQLIPEDVRKKRLKLLSLTKRDSLLNVIETHTFAYNESVPLPYKTSFSRDFWGYYNGAENQSSLTFRQHTLVPKKDALFTGIFPPMEDYPEPGAMRNCSQTCIMSGMLKSITYPTGGKAEFEFEPHTFGNAKILPKEAVDFYNRSFTWKYVSNYNAEGLNMSEMFTITHRQTVTFRVQVFFGSTPVREMVGSGGSIIFNNPNNHAVVRSIKITNEDAAPNPIKSFDRSDTITLDPGNYVISCGSTVQSMKTYATVSYRSDPFDFNAWQSTGAGVRIKTITKRNSDNSIQETVKYAYEDKTGRTSGMLLAPLDMVKTSNVRYITIEPSGEGLPRYHFVPYNFTTIYSSPAPVHPGWGCGMPVGYSRVICEKYDGAGNAGKTVSEFASTQGEVINYATRMVKFNPHNNGAPVKQQTYNSTNQLIKENMYEYEINDVKGMMLNLAIEDSYYGNSEFRCLNRNKYDSWALMSSLYLPRFRIALYPSVSYRVDLKKSSETFYYDGMPVTSNTVYTYNSRHQPKSITKTASQPGQSSTETFIYRADGDLDMKASNILSPVQSYTRQTGNSVTIIANQYDNWQQKFALLSTKEQIPPTGLRTVSYKYDPKWNPVELTFQNAVSDVYLWGYNYSYVIAHIKNTTYAAVSSLLGNNLTTLCSANVPDTALLNNLRNLFPDCEVTTWLYEPSFGVKQQTDPKGVITYYDYDSSGRLKETYIMDGNTKKVLQTHTYHYQNQ